MENALGNLPETSVHRQSDREAGWEDASLVIDLLKQMWQTTEFEPRVIPREWISQIISAARWTPSPFNHQPWYFIVVADRDAHRVLQDEVWRAARRLRRWRFLRGVFNKPMRDPLLKVSLVNSKSPQQIIFDHTIVLVGCVDPSKPEAATACAMALNNMALEAVRLGMGCAFTSLISPLDSHKRLKEALGAPPGYKFFQCLMIGFAKRGTNFLKLGRKEVSEISHWI